MAETILGVGLVVALVAGYVFVARRPVATAVLFFVSLVTMPLTLFLSFPIVALLGATLVWHLARRVFRSPQPVENDV